MSKLKPFFFRLIGYDPQRFKLQMRLFRAFFIFGTLFIIVVLGIFLVRVLLGFPIVFEPY